MDSEITQRIESLIREGRDLRRSAESAREFYGQGDMERLNHAFYSWKMRSLAEIDSLGKAAESLKGEVEKADKVSLFDLSSISRVLGSLDAALTVAQETRKVQYTLSNLIDVLRRFRECCQYLQQPPKNERDVQDILWIILRSHFERLNREDSLPRFGAKTYRPDFGVPELRTLVEAKFVGPKTAVPAIQEEILADVPAYLGSTQNYDCLVAFVYDAAQKLRDATKFVEDLRSVEGIADVIVVAGIA